ncbi:hypothetical protein DRO69_02095 [Candidatus Bathyarchaeota archaeon]|nr:MAG: hypothetical protein DRO69_02095 [Candidatus Bathyarchaeota archaeon]
MKCNLKVKIEDDVLYYTHVASKLNVFISQSDEEGVVWCQNCYCDDKSIFSVEYDGVHLFSLCLDCLKFLFDFFKERVSGE